ncbi:MAG: hypothetical protein M0R80_25860 [Proteobacteria bacterium]|nr:hypothetical protein [Pseudomonadota bacterium]
MADVTALPRGRDAAAETVARSFKNGQTPSAGKVLNPAALGLVVRYEKNGERMWKTVGRT